jgi:hypothetical protein
MQHHPTSQNASHRDYIQTTQHPHESNRNHPMIPIRFSRTEFQVFNPNQWPWVMNSELMISSQQSRHSALIWPARYSKDRQVGALTLCSIHNICTSNNAQGLLSTVHHIGATKQPNSNKFPLVYITIPTEQE